MKASRRSSDTGQVNYQVWIFIFSVISGMSLILCILTGVFIYTEDESQILDDSLCVRCRDLKIHPDDQLHNIQVYQGDVCCAKPEHLKDLVHNFAAVWYRRKLNKDNPKYKDCRTAAEVTPKPAVKLVGARKSHADINPRKVHWDKTTINRNPDVLIYSHGKIAVKQPGTYFIYGQMEYLCHFSEERLSTNYNIMQVARMPRRGREEIIMKTSSTPPDCNTTTLASYTSHVGTAIQLAKDDHIYVKVYCWDAVRNHSSLSFFGMHKVE